MRGAESGASWSMFSADSPVLCADARALSLSQGFYDQVRA